MPDTSSASFVVGFNLPTVLTGSALFASGIFLRGCLSSQGRKVKLIESPRKSLLPKLSKTEVSELPYPPDALPGARDIDSPFGSIRAYEWGSEDGPKVLLVHGISTPCLALGAVAHGLVENGCRVMLFDLFGRGYSDTPSDLPHDSRLFTSQIMLVLTSSPISWTGRASGKFALVGYSLGGGISAAFASYFPHLVSSLILIAPSGVVRPYNLARTTRILYSEGIIPESILHRVVRRRLKTPLSPPKKLAVDEKPGLRDAVEAEINLESNQQVLLSKNHPNITIEAAVRHQVDNHEGFVPAFMSSIRNGPITRQHELWKRIGKQLTEQNAKRGPNEDGFRKGKVLIILGSQDTIIKKDEVIPDATEVLEGNVEIKLIDAGHEAPVKHGDQVVKYIMEFWE